VRPTKLLCIFSEILGHNAEANRFHEALKRVEDVEITYLPIKNEDYLLYPAPWTARLTNPWHAQFVARQKAQSLLGEKLRDNFDMLVMNAWELMVEFHDLARKIPAACVLDAVPRTMATQRRLQGQKGLMRSTLDQLQNRTFSKVVGDYQRFFCKNSATIRSLQQDDQMPAERCVLALPAQDTELWKPAPRVRQRELRLLFVGNDFARKGGNLLLQVYTKHLAQKCSLTIASNDPTLEHVTFPAGVTWLRGKNREQLRDIYQSSDVFVFPTRQDFTPEVVGEALAMGLPCVAGEVDGIRDLLEDGKRGFVMPRDSSVEDWADRILRLAQPEELEKMSSGARLFAEQTLNFDRFRALVRTAVNDMRKR
jgi:hypothetical protein